MRRLILLPCCCIILSLIWSCGDTESRQQIDRLQHERDSLLSLADSTSRQLNQVTDYFDSIAMYIDSISLQESLMLVSIDPETNRRYTKAEMRQRLETLANTIARQRERIRLLTDSLNATNINRDKLESLSSMVVYLSNQLDQKEATVKQLMAELNTKNNTILNLTTSYNRVQSQLADANAMNEVLSTAVVEQSDMINETYLLVGDKKYLQSLGVMSKGGFLKKSKFNAGDIDLSKCQRVDMRQLRELPLNSKNPKILTAVPSGCYHWATGGSGTKTLVIDNPTSFWSLSNVLVIQL